MVKKKSNNKSSKKAAPSYPWDSWLNPTRKGSVTIPAAKFRTAVSTMSQQIRNAAKRRGLAVSLKVTDDSIKILEVNKRPTAKAKPKTATKKKVAA